MSRETKGAGLHRMESHKREKCIEGETRNVSMGPLGHVRKLTNAKRNKGNTWCSHGVHMVMKTAPISNNETEKIHNSWDIG